MSKHQKSPPAASKQPVPAIAAAKAPAVIATPPAAVEAAPATAPAAPAAAAEPVTAAAPLPAKPVAGLAFAPLFDFSRQVVAQVEQQSRWWMSQGLAPQLEMARAVAAYRSERFAVAQAMLKNVEQLFAA